MNSSLPSNLTSIKACELMGLKKGLSSATRLILYFLCSKSIFHDINGYILILYFYEIEDDPARLEAQIKGIEEDIFLKGYIG
jgi:hypothetical protein